MSQICHGPAWISDDVSLCIRERILRSIFPLTACAVSLLAIIAHILWHNARPRWKSGYQPLPADTPTRDEQDNDAESDLMLYKAISRETNIPFKVDRPKGRIGLVGLETCALLAVIGVYIAALATSSETGDGSASSIARLCSWVYILLLALTRLVLSTSDRPLGPKLWSHTAALYSLQWLFSVLVFRSVIVHPESSSQRLYIIIEFVLSSFLLLLTLTTRRGAKTLLVRHEDGLPPPKEPGASLLSVATFSWLDSLVWQGFKRPLEISDVWNIPQSYHAADVLLDFRPLRKSSVLAWRLLRYFDRILLLQGAWTIFSSLFIFMPTLLLKLILEYVEHPESTPRNAAWLYVFLLLCSGVIQGVSDGQALWIGRKLSVKLRAIIIGELYAKALRRKAGATVEAPKQDGVPATPKRKTFSFYKKKTVDSEPNQTASTKTDEASQQANVGNIINLMAIDSFKVSEVCAYLHFLWATCPVQVTLATFVLYKIVGPSSLSGIVLVFLLLPVNMVIARQFGKIQTQILATTDTRIHSTNEVLQNIRIIKYFAWEQRFEDIVNEKRKTELKFLRRRYILWSAAASLWYGTPILITFIVFFLYTVVEGKPLLPSIAFPALSMFSLLRVPLDQMADMVARVQESKVSIDRVEKFLNEEETEKYTQLREDDDGPNLPPKIGLENATLSWGSSNDEPKSTGGDGDSNSFRLIKMNVSFQVGELNIIAGPTGSGKTSLLMALLGEMKLIEGRVMLPGGTCNRVDLIHDPATGLTESIAYCAQEPWLVNATIKDNILFSAPFDEDRYREVLKACSLERDLEILDAGDQTQVGEKGISLSGGQKQRISLARGMYSNARHLLLDDCLSAVDSHTAKHIFNHAITGPLMMGRTCILVTHNVSLAMAQASHAVIMDNGRVKAQGTPKELVRSGILGEELLQSRSGSRTTSKPPSLVSSTEGREWSTHQSGIANGDSTENANGATAPKKKRTDMAEEKKIGSVKTSTIRMYLSAMGPWYFWIAAVIVFAAQQVGSVGANIWIREWANAYHVERSAGANAGTMAAMSDFKTPSFVTANVPRLFSWKAPHLQSTAGASVASASDSDVDVKYYLGIYALLGIAYVFISLTREVLLFWGSLHASWKLHRRLLSAITHAKFKFFDSTPLGQIMNRFSKDVQSIDQEVAPTAIGMIHSLASVILIVILISVITPGFLIGGVFISMIYCALGTIYLNSSRDLKRLESVQRSPLYQQFGETLNGIVTIRAYGDSARFILDNHKLINTYNRPYIYLWAANRWLAFRVDLTGAFVAFLSGAFIILNTGKIDAGAAGLSLTYAVTFSENILWLVRLYAENQQNMNSVERLEEYLEVEQEARAIVPEKRPPSKWPTQGELKFIDYTTRYRPDLDPVLRNVSFTVQPGERVGIVGRTGAGKTSLALALFRGLEAESGKIVIDGIDIGLIGLRDLREAITIVPQDPTLFTGTIRTNLDPFGLFTDEEIFTALRRVHLIGPAGSQVGSEPQTPIASQSTTSDDDGVSDGTAVASTSGRDNKNVFLNLESAISESGSNLSQGQRQLLCLARALLKSPKVLLMDEATASIDYATDSKIQDTLRDLKDNTIITIAHRLQTIIDYDKVLVLERGEVVEFDGPWQLLSKEDGAFRAMCENTGNLEALIEGAKKAWEKKRLVDDS
ncbi:hypothetical protein AJ80_05099 [Polytolypa hystricis UAMH7299]|uniref:ATP-dependent bile acid permease n=1 Tax=Polytolypa hystricis (strain UAMH7299) TaxID=1447883 RepID=A0A2B7XYB3_POLH7|nr:hypothetical protein AJ80_05099 [Polytolypa hystricis UAMH7299]